jgi:Holliday junction resolvasome RuvABC endonuclease subunit
MLDPIGALSQSVVAIDPGLDRVAIARFVLPDRNRRGLSVAAYWSKALPDEKACAFMDAKSFDTKPSEEIPERLADIANWLREQLFAIRPKLILIEMPAYASTYARHMENGARSAAAVANGQNKLYMSIGAIFAAAWSVECAIVRAVPAQSTNKKQRLAIVEMLLKAAGKERPKNEDQRDAVSIGLAATWDL